MNSFHESAGAYIRIAGEGVIVERMSLTTTKLIIIMKLIYRDKIMGEGLNATTTTLAQIREYGRNTNLIDRRPYSAGVE